ncbi:MAG: DUF533 domain-containing protein [Planctomycetota bacterium]
MTPDQADAIAALCVFAAFADGSKGDAEREHIKAVFETLDGASHAGVYQRVMLKKTSATAEAAKLDTSELRSLAYEMAVAVCDADGVLAPAEREFLKQLAADLGIAGAEASTVEDEYEQVARELGAAPDDSVAVAPIPLEAEPAPAPPPAATPAPNPVDAEVDRMVLKYAILNAALELLPQNLATLAIIPIQTKMVYRVGKRYGVNLDAGHIKEFIGVVGVGMTGQVVENFARDLFGKIGKKVLGKTMGGMGKKVIKQTTSSLMTFATTYALGRVAKQYYAGGRTLSAIDLKSLFTSEVAQGKQVFEHHRPQIEQTSQTINPADVLKMVRGGGPL